MTMAGERLYITRTAAQLRKDRERGAAAWQSFAGSREEFETVRRENREASTEARRRLEALRRINAALLERSEKAAAASQKVIGRVPARAVVVHRLDWMRERLALGLDEHGIAVVARERDGADGLGITIAEQPELLIVEDRLPSVRAVDLVRSLRDFAPNTVVAAQVEHADELDELIEAGAAAVFGRRVPPADVCAQLAGYLRSRPGEPLIMA
jgi:hypothetical protein